MLLGQLGWSFRYNFTDGPNRRRGESMATEIWQSATRFNGVFIHSFSFGGKMEWGWERAWLSPLIIFLRDFPSVANRKNFAGKISVSEPYSDGWWSRWSFFLRLRSNFLSLYIYFGNPRSHQWCCSWTEPWAKERVAGEWVRVPVKPWS